MSIKESIDIYLDHSKKKNGKFYTSAYLNIVKNSIYNAYIKLWPKTNKFDITYFTCNKNNCIIKLNRKKGKRKPPIASHIDILLRGYETLKEKTLLDKGLNTNRKNSDDKMEVNNIEKPKEVVILNEPITLNEEELKPSFEAKNDDSVIEEVSKKVIKKTKIDLKEPISLLDAKKVLKTNLDVYNKLIFVNCKQFPCKKFKQYIKNGNTTIRVMSEHKIKSHTKRIGRFFGSICLSTFNNLEFIIRRNKFNIAYFYINPIANIRAFVKANRNNRDEVISLFSFLSSLLESNGFVNISKLYKPSFIKRFFLINDYCFDNEYNFYNRIDYNVTNELINSKDKNDLLNVDTRIKLGVIPKNCISETIEAYNDIHYYYVNDELSNSYLNSNSLKLKTIQFYNFFWSRYNVNFFTNKFDVYYDSYNPKNSKQKRIKYTNIQQTMIDFVKPILEKNTITNETEQRNIVNKVKELTAKYLKTTMDIFWKNKSGDCSKKEFYIRIKDIKKDYERISKNKLNY